MFALAIVGTAMASCNEYLDKLPDDRADVNTLEKVQKLNTSAYPQGSANLVLEMLSDNVLDYGNQYSAPILCDELYRFKDVTDQGNDSPYNVWNHFYEAVATANQSLRSLEEMGMIDAAPSLTAEAKLCRAYSMFMLAQVFCMEWNPEKADEYYGLPYPTEPQEDLTKTYKRGTLRELYAAIDKDIEESLPYIDDEVYGSTPKYHFNRQAAYAFAARFNLYYLNFDKVIAYANEVLGTGDPTSRLRNYAQYEKLGRRDIANLYVASSEPANLLLTTPYSIAPYYLGYGGSGRFGHNQTVTTYQTYWVEMPWGRGSTDNTLYYAKKMYGSVTCVAFPKLDPFFEYTDRVAGIGYYHGVDPVFTTDETLLCRAEAYTLKGETTWEKAVEDINYWITTHCKEEEGKAVRPVMTVESINTFMEGVDTTLVNWNTVGDLSIRNTLHPQGFTVAPGTQDNMVQFILQMRRLETIFQGLRFADLKRYGIEYIHKLRGEDPVLHVPGDKRDAVQLPIDVITAGLEPNPRD